MNMDTSVSKTQGNISRKFTGAHHKISNYHQGPNAISEQLTTTNPQNNEQFHVTHLPKNSPAVTKKYGDNSPREARKKNIAVTVWHQTKYRKNAL
jgi:hypothetical protein